MNFATVGQYQIQQQLNFRRQISKQSFIRPYLPRGNQNYWNPQHSRINYQHKFFLFLQLEFNGQQLFKHVHSFLSHNPSSPYKTYALKLLLKKTET